MPYLLDFRVRDTGGAVVPGFLSEPDGGRAGPRAEEDLAHEPALVFLLHGFNVSRPAGRKQLLALADLLPSAAGETAPALVATLWPGDHWTGPLSYPFEGRDADDSATELARFIERVVPSGTPLSFVAHSLGSRVVMEALTRLLGSGYPVEQVCLMAAAIDDFSLAAPPDYNRATVAGRRVAVLSSRRDRVLQLAYPVGDLLQAFFFFRRDQAGLALGYHGPRPHKASRTGVPGNVLHHPIPKKRRAGHFDYLPDTPPNDEQRSAARFADDVLAGRPAPAYP